jgi:DNA-binding NtrC family response regulator
VLVAEDDRMVRKLLIRSLEIRGYHVLAAGNPREALRLSAEHDGPIDLVLTDLVMPGGSGTDLATKVADARPEVQKLFISGYAHRGVLNGGRLDEELEFLGKPFTASQLARRVRDILDKRAVGKLAEPSTASR